MDKREAHEVLEQQLKRYRGRTYAELQGLVGHPEAFEAHGSSGSHYQLEVEAVWDDRRGGNLRIVASIDDGGVRALWPITGDFIVAADGRFVGD